MIARDLLERNIHLCIWCTKPSCRRKVRWTAVEACERLGPDTDVHAAARRMRCQVCGARGRDGFLDIHPCTLDDDAWRTRDVYRRAIAAGEPPLWSLEERLATLRGLIFEGGDRNLGGDGPVRWPVN